MVKMIQYARICATIKNVHTVHNDSKQNRKALRPYEAIVVVRMYIILARQCSRRRQ